MFKNIVHWTRVDPAPLGRVTLEGAEPSEPLSVPMCILSLVHELEDAGIQTPDLAEIRTWAVSSIKLHIQRDGTRVLENVSPDGKQVQGSAGRLMNPGIEPFRNDITQINNFSVERWGFIIAVRDLVPFRDRGLPDIRAGLIPL